MQPLDILRPLPLAGRVALVTGVSRRIGIGYAVSRRLLEMGADLFIQSWTPHDAAQPWGADPEGIAVVLSELRASGRRVEHLEADFLDADAPARVVDAAYAAFGNVDILVANHARSGHGTLEELTAAEIDAMMAVNVRATLLLVKEWAARHDDRRPGGRVVLMTSGQHRAPMPGELAYAASKGALAQLTASLAAHLASREITVNTVNPGPTDTGYATPELYQSVASRHPRGRWGEPDDAARLIAWLATDDARWITGQVLNSEGGWR